MIFINSYARIGIYTLQKSLFDLIPGSIFGMDYSSSGMSPFPAQVQKIILLLFVAKIYTQCHKLFYSNRTILHHHFYYLRFAEAVTGIKGIFDMEVVAVLQIKD